MKITSLIMSIFLVLVLCIGVVMVFFNLKVGNELYEEQAYRQLITIATSKAERVETFLSNRKADAVFLAGSEDVRSIFDEEVIKDTGIMMEKIKSIAGNTRDEIEAYINEHPSMTVADLQNDKVFQSIAIQRVGETGYTLVGDMEADTVLFHKFPEQIGYDINELKAVNLPLWEQYLNTQKFKESFGYYSFEEPDGTLRDQYHYTFGLNVAPRDSGELFLTAVLYVDEFGGAVRLVSDLDRGFKLFQEKKEYEDLIFIDPEGDVIWTAKQHNELGTNLMTGVYNESLLANVFNKAKKDLGVGVSESSAYGPEDSLSIFVTAPVMNVNNLTGKMELQGIVALELDGEKISELIENDLLLGETGAVYIINREGNHITTLKSDEHTSVASERIHEESAEVVTSEGIENCFDDYNNYYFALQGEVFDGHGSGEPDIEEAPKASRYLDYAEDSNKVLGAHQYILESGWCVIAEMDENYYLDIIPKTNVSLIINLLVISLLLLIGSLLLDSFFEIRRDDR